MSLPTQPGEMVNTSAPRSGLPGTYNTNNPNYPNMPPTGQGTFPSQRPPSSMYNNTTMPAPPSGPSVPDQSNQPNQQPGQPQGPFGPQQQSGFYQDATEAITSLPPNRGQGYAPGYQQPQQGFTGIQGQSGYAGGGQYNAQVPYQTTNFPATNYPASQTPAGQGYGYGTPSQPTPPPKKQTSAALVFAIVALVVAIITVSAFGAIILLRNHG
ncbi:MAG TPA: hypothetical protein VKU38_02465, partial [Ktedonobacteraceae bacterium]|nr:hypothetical protein [Ktedonobacteraceae bacterium]